MPYFLHICVLRGFSFAPSLSYPCPVYALFVFLCVHLFTILYIILSFWADLSILSNRFYAYLLKLNFSPIHYILCLYGQDISQVFHHLLFLMTKFFFLYGFYHILHLFSFWPHLLPYYISLQYCTYIRVCFGYNFSRFFYSNARIYVLYYDHRKESTAQRFLPI